METVRYETEKPLGGLRLSVETLSLFLRKRIVCLGIDSPTWELPMTANPPASVRLGRRMIYVRKLANLDAVPATGATFFCSCR